MINLYRAVKSSHLNQAFGENLVCVKVDEYGTAIRPFRVAGGLFPSLCPPGYRRFYPLIGMKGHNGRDWMAYHGEPVYFSATNGSADPIVGTCYTEIDADGGKGVDIVFQDPDTLEWFQLKEWHLLEQKVYDGQVIKSGDLIGYADSTGASGGDHLHNGLKPLNSNNLEKKKFPANGYTGAVDPVTYPGIQDYQATSFILDILNRKQQLTLLQMVYELLSIIKGRQG